MSRRYTFFVITITVVSVVGALSASPVPPHVKVDSVRSTTLEVQRDSGKVPVESRLIIVQIQTPNQKTMREAALMLYDPRSKAFWWDNSLPLEVESGKMLPKNSAMFVTESKFILFWNGFVSGDSVLILESTEHYSSLDDGQAHVLQELEARREDIQEGRFLHQFKKTKPFGLDEDFLYKKLVANPIGPTLRDVKRVGNEWHIVEDGPNGGSALIVLNDQYQVLKTTILPSK